MITILNILENIINSVSMLNINTTCDFIYYQETFDESLLKYLKK